MENNETIKYPTELDQLGDYIRSRGDTGKQSDALDACVGLEFKRLGVPDCGTSTTLEGEFIRAIAKIRYRWYNDGDRFYKGYGVETAGPSAAFLQWAYEVKHIPEQFGCAIVDWLDQAEGADSDDDYEEAIEFLAHYTLLYTMSIPTEKLRENPGLDNLEAKIPTHWLDARDEYDEEEDSESYDE
jgi:hypothetical protein